MNHISKHIFLSVRLSASAIQHQEFMDSVTYVFHPQLFYPMLDFTSLYMCLDSDLEWTEWTESDSQTTEHVGQHSVPSKVRVIPASTLKFKCIVFD
jgi:hypothetical protein